MAVTLIILTTVTETTASLEVVVMTVALIILRTVTTSSSVGVVMTVTLIILTTVTKITSCFPQSGTILLRGRKDAKRRSKKGLRAPMMMRKRTLRLARERVQGRSSQEEKTRRTSTRTRRRHALMMTMTRMMTKIVQTSRKSSPQRTKTLRMDACAVLGGCGMREMHGLLPCACLLTLTRGWRVVRVSRALRRDPDLCHRGELRVVAHICVSV